MIRALFVAVRRVEAAVVAGGILGIAGLTIANVFTRTALGFSLAWAEELSQILMVAVTFVGLSLAAGDGRHIRMTALVDALPERWRKRTMVAVAGSTALLLLALAGFAVQYLTTLHALGSVSPALRLPLWAAYAVVPVGLVLGAVQYGLTVATNLTADGVWVSPVVRDGADAAPPSGIG